MHILENKELTIEINPSGAELTSIVGGKNNHQYLWQGDPRFWKRHSPVLFPIVGSLWNGEFHYEGKTYKMSQHGFARDCDFELIKETPSSATYLLKSDTETLKLYPFPFELEIGYELVANTIRVKWSVRNTGDKTMYFQIGAHPAFNYPDFDENDSIRGYFSFDKKQDLECILIKEKGCVDPTIVQALAMDKNGHLPIEVNTFDHDALILEKSQVHSVSLLTKEKKPYLSLHFDAPLVGLWSPADKACPFVCIEPWYGRCDRVGYIGDVSGRDYINSLDAGSDFEVCYKIEIAVD